MSRADELRALIAMVEAGTVPDHSDFIAVFPVESAYGRNPFHDAWDACRGDLNAVARLEPSLRERGQAGPFVSLDETGKVWTAGWMVTKEDDLGTEWADLDAHAPTEAPARLLGVLNVLLFEEGGL